MVKNHRPNIRPAIPPHEACSQQDRKQPSGFPGDVRRCIHGKIQLLTAVSVDAPVQGPRTHWWRTLSKFWDRRTYRLAEEALRAGEDF